MLILSGDGRTGVCRGRHAVVYGAPTPTPDPSPGALTTLLMPNTPGLAIRRAIGVLRTTETECDRARTRAFDRYQRSL